MQFKEPKFYYWGRPDFFLFQSILVAYSEIAALLLIKCNSYKYDQEPMSTEGAKERVTTVTYFRSRVRVLLNADQ